MMRQKLREHLALTISVLRPSWDVAGIRKALDDPALNTVNEMAVAQAALRCAADEKNRTPAVIPMQGPHWEVARAVVQTPLPPRFVAPAPLTDTEHAAAQHAAQQAKQALRRSA
jgi:hypothetical protein